MLQLENLVWKEGKYYVAKCLNVEVSSYGNTKQEALDNLKEALDLYFEDNDLSSFTSVEEPELIHSIAING